jgi:Tfp pilus assembly protein PilV
MNRKALTILEILVSAVIFSLVMLGLTNIFISAKRYILHNRARMTSGELGKLFLDPLQMEVRQDLWQADTQCLTSNGSSCSTTAQTINNIAYAPEYSISALLTDAQNPLGRIRKVNLTLTWEEPAP